MQPHLHWLLSLIGITPKLSVPCKWDNHNSSVTGSLFTKDCPFYLTPFSAGALTLVQP